MAVRRMTAWKVHISDITSGTWVQKEGLEPSYVQTPSGEQLSRVRIVATVVGKFVNEDSSFASITLDDGRDTIRARVFKDIAIVSALDPGNLVDAIGKAREYNGEVYINLESAFVITDPNMELLRRLEIAKQRLGRKSMPPGQEAVQPKDEMRKRLLSAIEAEREGISFDSLLEKTAIPESDAEGIINDLLAEGICYEPSPGKIRKI